MQVVETEIADIKIFKPVRHTDSRGFFSEVFKEDELRKQVKTAKKQYEDALRKQLFGF